MLQKVNNSILISIIIPCYNGEGFIAETIRSVFNQTYTNFEIIVVDDGSIDQTKKIVSNYLNDQRIKYYYQKNQGVSSARNHGLSLATGNFVAFIDADDLIEPDFLKKRLLFLQNHSYYSACGTSINIIDENGTPTSIWHIGIHDNFLKQILTYKTTYSTCPSNYLFNREILIKNNLLFNASLSSSADRFFLIECSRFIEIGLLYNDYNSRLLYRLHQSNMSRAISPSLLKDNITFMEKVFALNYIPTNYKKIFTFKLYFILSGGNLRLKKYPVAFAYALLAFIYSPIKFIKQLCAA
jgi:glycosyltransferase involved in cell wall biosynthesis